MFTRVTYLCGCVNVVADEAFGALKSLSKCAKHKSQAGRGGRAYYEELGAIKDGCPQSDTYAKELQSALAEMGCRLDYGVEYPYRAIEIGCGVGGYIPLLLKLGYLYIGFEPDGWAAQYCRTAFCANAQQGFFEDADLSALGQVELILAAHVLEHAKDAPLMLRKIIDALRPDGQLILIVPDDQDPVNQDHLWFFNQQNLTDLLAATGFTGIKSTVKRVVPHEQFMYFSACKPLEAV